MKRSIIILSILLTCFNAVSQTTSGNVLQRSDGVLQVGNGKTITVSNSVVISGTDGATLNVGTGGTPVMASNNLSDVTASTARNNILPSKTGQSLKFLRVNAGETDYELTTIAAGGDMLGSNNLSELTNTTTARSNLGVVIGTHVQAYDADLDTYAGITPSANVQTLLSAANYAAFKASLSLDNVTNESKSTMFTNSVFTGTFNVADGAIANADLANSAVANLSGTNTGDNAANTTYANDYRAANFVAGTNYLAPNGSAAALTNNTGGWTTLRVSGSNATTTGQTLVDITGLVSATLSNSTMYEIEVVLSTTTSNVSTGITYGIATGGTGSASVVNSIITATTTAAAASSTTINTAATKTIAYLTASSISGTVIIKGYVTTRGSGTATISIQHSKETSGTSTVLIGSVFRYRLAQ